MAASVNPPRGMRDFLPTEKRKRDAILRTIVSVYERHGFEPIETPVMEDHSVLHSGLGGDNEKLSFQILRRGLSIDEVKQASRVDELADLGLRFDLTVPLARFVASHHSELPGVFRALHVAPVWRAERPQKGRFRQFMQCDIDIVGERTTLAEREVLMATADALNELGMDNYRFRVNDRRLLAGVLAAAKVSEADSATVLVILDKLDKIGAGGVVEELKERLGSRIDYGALEYLLATTAEHPLSWESSAIAQLMSVDESVAAEVVEWAVDLAGRIGPQRVVFDPTLVRGMGYYTGSIVELEHPELGVSLGGGGRYDGMIGRFLKKDLPAFGFSLGFERLMDVVAPPEVDATPRVALVYGDGISVERVLSLKAEIVATGKSVRLVAASKNAKALFDRLEADGFGEVAEVRSEHGSASELAWRELGTKR